ncbi:hypothetical protein CsSME_00053359 [Camellia sinensis var. sinensis]
MDFLFQLQLLRQPNHCWNLCLHRYSMRGDLMGSNLPNNLFYKSLKSSIDKASKKLETMKTDSNPSKLNLKKSKTKKIDHVKSNLKDQPRSLPLQVQI